jgi:transposase
LPWRGATVRLRITVRRFRCRNGLCDRMTFAEDFGAMLPRRAQRTAAATDLLLQFVQATGGEAGARLAQAAGLPTSPDTLLRLLRRQPEPSMVTPCILGVDDFALRRGHRYGTILVDLVTRRPIDLLADREASTLADWLRKHPGVVVIVRDRSLAYAEGASAGAPDALQVADRFHLVQNASGALDELLGSRHHGAVTLDLDADPSAPSADAPTVDDPHPIVPVPQPVLSKATRIHAERLARRTAWWEEIRRRRVAGQSISQIARAVDKDRKTVRRYLAAPAPPPTRTLAAPRIGGLRSPTLAPFVDYLHARWRHGCHNASQLYRELVAHGYTGSATLLRTAVAPWRPPRPPPGERRRLRRLRIRWLCLRPPEQLTPEERATLDRVLAADLEVATGYRLLQQFRALVKDRDTAALDTWLTDARQSTLAPFVSLANGLVADRHAVEAALRLPWSTGPVEGHVHRLKLIKRQGYGRANLDLLRRRVLAS